VCGVMAGVDDAGNYVVCVATLIYVDLRGEGGGVLLLAQNYPTFEISYR
jgi:hypothetical protein